MRFTSKYQHNIRKKDKIEGNKFIGVQFGENGNIIRKPVKEEKKEESKGEKNGSN